MNIYDDFLHRIERYEAIIKSHEDAATRKVNGIWSFSQPIIYYANQIIRYQEALIARVEADREAQKRDILSHASEVTSPTRILLADAKHQLAAISAPIHRLPTECIAGIMQYFNVDHPIVVLLLVSRRWHAIAKATPQLWSKIALVHGPNAHQLLRLKGVHVCGSLEHLSSVLSFSGALPLDIELCARHGSMRFAWGIFRKERSLNPNATFLYNDQDWFDDGLMLLAADGRRRRWRTLSITSWSRRNGTPCKAIIGPFDNLRLLSIHPSSSSLHPDVPIFEPLVAAVIQGAPRLSAVVTNDSFLFRRVRKDPNFWKTIESYHSLAPCDDLSFLSHASRLTDLSLSFWQSFPQRELVSLPCLRTLRLFQPFIDILAGFRLPVLETLILSGARFVSTTDFKPISVPSVTSIISTSCSDVRVLRRISAPALYHLNITSEPGAQVNIWQNTFTETFDGSPFMPRPKSFHINIPITDLQLLSALDLLPQIEELRIVLVQPLGPEVWRALTPTGADGRRKDTQYCPKLRIMVMEIKSIYVGREILSRASLKLGIEMATAREREGQGLTHLIFSWCDGSKDEVLGSLRSLPVYPSREPITQDSFINASSPLN